jgi:galactosylceramidase
MRLLISDAEWFGHQFPTGEVAPTKGPSFKVIKLRVAKSQSRQGLEQAREQFRSKGSKFRSPVLASGLVVLAFLAAAGATPLPADQTIAIDGSGPSRRFDGIGTITAGGPSVLLKDYPEIQRQQILDFLFKPKFGASISALYVEIGGDGNSTQGSELSHMHSRDEENYRRGYEWWLMKEAKRRNPYMSLDGCGWSCPGWVGQGNYYSQDMCDYYAKWIQGLRSTYGLKLDAIGCRNESGVHEDFAKSLRRTLDREGLKDVIIHAFDNWKPDKWDWCAHLKTDADLRNAIGVLSNHILSNVVEKDCPTPDSVKQLSLSMKKPIWDTEEHIYKDGYDCEILLVKAFNLNFIDSGATKIVNWYLVDSLYGVEGFKKLPGMLIADSPWSGHYSVREVLWGYAHYGQFCQIGWNYLTNACGHLAEGGSYVTLKSPSSDYSVIAETQGAPRSQTLRFNLSGGVSTGPLCVWRSNSREQFVRQADVTPVNGTYSVTLDPDSIYSLSTTTGQRKGSFADIPEPKPFPFPYRDNFDSYGDASNWGYLPHYTADVAGGFELAQRPDGQGQCLRQVTDQRAQNWGPEWMPLTLIGDMNWRNYEVSCDVLLDRASGMAGIMGRISNSCGKDNLPKGYFLSLSTSDGCALYSTNTGKEGGAYGTRLAYAAALKPDPKAWHTLKLRFAESWITAFVDGTPIGSVINADCPSGLVGLVTSNRGSVTTAYFANLIVKPVGAADPAPTSFGPERNPLYSAVSTLIH